MTERETRPLVYLAGPVDLVVPGGGTGGAGRWKPNERKVVEQLWAAGLNVYSPLLAFYVHGDSVPNGTIQAVNREAVGACDALVAVWPKGVPSLGTPVEIDYHLWRMEQLGVDRRTYLVDESGWLDGSWQVAAWQERGLVVVRTVEDAALLLAEAFDVKQTADAEVDEQVNAPFVKVIPVCNYTTCPIKRPHEKREHGNMQCSDCGTPQGAYHGDGCKEQERLTGRGGPYKYERSGS